MFENFGCLNVFRIFGLPTMEYVRQRANLWRAWSTYFITTYIIYIGSNKINGLLIL